MTSPEPVSQSIERVVLQLEGITKELKAIREDQVNIAKRRRRDRRQFWVVTGCMVLDILLSISLAVVAVSQVSATNNIRDNQARLAQTQQQFHDSQVANCEAGNVTRLENKTYQLYFLQIIAAPIVDQPVPSPRAKAEIRKRLQELSDRLNAIFAPVDCQKRFPTVTPPISATAS